MIYKYAAVLGGTNPHIALINLLKKKGYKVLLFDSRKQPPARPYCDFFFQISIFDFEKIFTELKKYNISLVISACVDHANVTAIDLCSRLGLHTPYNSKIALQTSNKYYMKKIMLESKIPTSKLYESQDQLTFPVVVKPTDCGGSKGVRKVGSYNEYIHAVNEARKRSKTNNFIVEEYIDGIEISVDAVVVDGKSEVLLIREKFIRGNTKNSVISNFASISPSKQVNQELKNKINKVVQSISDAFCLNNTPLLVQMLICENDCFVIEFAPRVGGGLNFRAVEIMSGVDIIKFTYDCFIGNKTIINPNKRKVILLCYHLYTKPCQFREITGYEKCIKEGLMKEIYIHKNTGESTSSNFSSSDRVASFIVEASDHIELKFKVNKILEQIDIYSMNNESVAIKEWL